MNIKNILSFNTFSNFVIIFMLLYLFYHLIYGKYNVGNYLINDFKKIILNDNLDDLNLKISSIDKDLYSLYTNKDDFIDEIAKRKYEYTSPGELLIKIN
jgi:cell division protein FtsB|tara:strand:+ start:3149 stop:3445 length:297 start_codon:yes stop_codon:yes gene_type:complete